MSGHPLWVLLAAVIAGLLAVIAALPDPGQPAIIPLGGVLGGFIAATIARVRSGRATTSGTPAWKASTGVPRSPSRRT
jgi:hypothetical protein